MAVLGLHLSITSSFRCRFYGTKWEYDPNVNWSDSSSAGFTALGGPCVLGGSSGAEALVGFDGVLRGA